MATPPHVFISATSGDLRSIRELAKNALLTINCHPVEQTNFEPDWRTVDKMLHAKIEACQALVHIVGLRYGAEPDPATLPKGAPRRSYTQMEYHIGRALQAKRGDKRFRVYTFVCPEDFPYDPEPDTESDDKREWQRLHRQGILSGDFLFEQPTDLDKLKERILSLQEQVPTLLHEQETVLSALGDVEQSLQTLAERERDNRQLLEEIIANTRSRINPLDSLSPQQHYDQALQEVAFKHDLKPDELRAAIDAWTKQVKNDPHADFYDVALTEYKANHFDAAAEQAGKAYNQAMAARGQATADAMKAARLEGNAYEAKGRYDLALAAYRKAAALTEQAKNPLLWAEEQNLVALMLLHLARYSEAESLMHEILAVREQRLGLDHPDTATALNNLAQLLQATNRLAEAEPLMRRALAIDEASYGQEHPNVAIRLNNLAQLLQATNRLAEAEPLMRRAFLILIKFTRQTGHQHPHLRQAFFNHRMLLTELKLSENEISTQWDRLVGQAGLTPAEWQKLLASLTDT